MSRAGRPGGRLGGQTGRVSRARGERAEDLILAAAARYAREGLAWVFKRPTPVKALGQPDARGRFPACWLAKAGCDFAGVLAGGRSLLVELKTSSVPRLPLARRGGATLADPQADELAVAHSLGAWAGVLVRVAPGAGGACWGPPRGWYLLPWLGWQAAVEAAPGASLGLDALAAHGHAVDPHDWLRPVLGG